MHPCTQARTACADMSKGATLARQLALALRPRPLPELLAAGRTLQVDLPAYPELTWMIDLVLCNDYIPIGWEQAMHGPYTHACTACTYARMHACAHSHRLRAPLHSPHLSLHLSLCTAAPPHRRTALPCLPRSAHSLAPVLAGQGRWAGRKRPRRGVFS